MKKLNSEQLEYLGGGTPCQASAGVIMAFGLTVATVPTPLNWAFGGVVAAVGAASYFACR